MAQNIASAGYIIANNEAIFGVGSDETAARADFLANMESAGVRVIDEPTEADLDNYGDWTRDSDYKMLSASAALIQRVVEFGGSISWINHLGVACTEDEVEADVVASR